MLHHIEIYVSNLAKSKKFYTKLLGKIGYELRNSWSSGFTLTKPRGGYFTFVQVEEKHAARPYHRCAVGLNHLAFKVKTRKEVDALRSYCEKQKITMLYDDRYPFAGGETYYALFIEDPDRIKLEFKAG